MVKTARNPRRAAAGKRAAAKTEATTVNAAAFEKFLKGIHFPVNKQGLIDYLHKNQATDSVMDIANQFSERDYMSVADVAKEFSRVKRN